MASLRAALKRRGVRIVSAVLLCLSLVAGVMAVAARTADSVTIKVQKVDVARCTQGVDCRPLMSDIHAGEQVLKQTYRDDKTVRQIQDVVNGTPRGETELQLSFENGLCDNLPGNAIYLYDFRFEWRGFTTQEAVVNSWCPDWHITTLGLPSIFSHLDASALPKIASTADLQTTP